MAPYALAARAGFAAALALGVHGSPATAAPSDCMLVVEEHRSGRLLAQWPVPEWPARFQIRFVHSVLGTPVQDHYEMRRAGTRVVAHLVQEDFAGEGYGLPYGATGAGETLERTPDGWRLRLDRVVDPLVQLPLPEQQVRLEWAGHSVRLADLSLHSQRIALRGCRFG